MRYYEKMIILQRNDTCMQKDTRPGCLELSLLLVIQRLLKLRIDADLAAFAFDRWLLRLLAQVLADIGSVLLEGLGHSLNDFPYIVRRFKDRIDGLDLPLHIPGDLIRCVNELSRLSRQSMDGIPHLAQRLVGLPKRGHSLAQRKNQEHGQTDKRDRRKSNTKLN